MAKSARPPKAARPDKSTRSGKPSKPARPVKLTAPPRVAAAPVRPAGDLLFGRNVVAEALRAGRSIQRVLIAATAHGDPIVQVAEAARSRGVPIETIDPRRLDALAEQRGMDHHQGVVAFVAPFRYAALDDIITAARSSVTPPLILVLDTLQDPQNFGALLRSAAAAGADGAIIPEHRAVGVTPAVSRVSAGATEHLPIAQVGNLARALGALKEAGLWVVGLDIRAETSHVEAALHGPLAIVVGGEGRGIRPLIRQTCDFLVRLPMPGPIESLNAAVAGSIVLYEVLRQRGAAGSQELEVPSPDSEPRMASE